MKLNQESASSRPRGDQSGFSIIEMMIAVVVLAVGLVSIVGVSVYVFRANAISNHMNVLTTAAQDQVDRLRGAVWTATAEDPTISVGGSISDDSGDDEEEPLMSSTTTSSTTTTDTDYGYGYTLDPENPHRATVDATPIGELTINWQVTQGGTPDLRIVTIRVVQVGAPPNLRDGFTITTMIVRN